MVKSLFSKGKKIFFAPQTSILSAATIIMVMFLVSRVLGLVRQRVLAFFFTPSQLALFFAAFRMPDLVFEVLVFGALSSAFIPVFTKSIKKDGNGRAWETAGIIINIGVLIFSLLAVVAGFFADKIYLVIAPGFSYDQVQTVASLTRVLFFAQVIFVASYVATGVLESLKRFLVPALAPILYNLGIILATVLFSKNLGLMAPALGVVLGAILHFLIQLPFALKLGFRFTKSLKITPEVRHIGELAFPRVLDLSFQQIEKTAELFLASLISLPSYTYYTLANTLQLLPVSLFGTSLSKAALPTLSSQEDDKEAFRKTLLSVFWEIMFFVLPLAAILIVLRIPLVRLIYGTDIFDWEATVQTGLVLTAFAFGVPFQAAVSLFSKAFYALHDTKTPVVVSLASVFLIVIGDFVLVKLYALPVWALAASFSLGVFIQSVLLFFLLGKRVGYNPLKSLGPVAKSLTATLVSGSVSFFLLKIFDRSVWVKKLSFLGNVDSSIKFLTFQKFVLDTRYTFNLILLTLAALFVGAVVYIFLSWVFRSKELSAVLRLIRKKTIVAPVPEEGQIAPAIHSGTEKSS